MMKYIIGSFLLLTFMCSCDGVRQSKTQINVIDTLNAYKYKELGKVKSVKGDKRGAIKDYTKAILLNPDYDIAYYNRANAKMSIKDYKGALDDYAKAIELNRKFTQAYYNRALLKFEMGNYEGEISDYHLAIKYGEPDADLYNNLGRALYDLNRFKESAEAYGEGIKYFPEDYRLYYGRGLARKRTGDKNGACEDWIKSSELGCIQANMLLPLCEEYIKGRNDSLKKEKESANKIE